MPIFGMPSVPSHPTHPSSNTLTSYTDEIIKLLQLSKTGSAVGPDDLSSTLLKSSTSSQLEIRLHCSTKPSLPVLSQLFGKLQHTRLGDFIKTGSPHSRYLFCTISSAFSSLYSSFIIPNDRLQICAGFNHLILAFCLLKSRHFRELSWLYLSRLDSYLLLGLHSVPRQIRLETFGCPVSSPQHI